MTLRGQLEHFGLGELFQTLALNQHTGTLFVESRGESKSIYFSTGSISFVGHGAGKSMRLGEILVRSGKVTEADVELAMREQGQGGNLLGRILVDRGLITQDDIRNALRIKVQEELYDLFLWEQGTFEFRPDYCPPELADPLQRNTQVSIDPQAILMEGLRLLDELRVFRTHVSDARSIIERGVPSLPSDESNSASDLRLWELTVESKSLEEIVRASSDSRFQTLRSLHRFIENGWLQPMSYGGYIARLENLIKRRDTEAAYSLTQFLLETSAEAKRDPAFLSMAAQFLIDHDQRDQAATILLEAMRQYQANGQNDKAWEAGSVVLRRGTRSVELLQALWKLRAQGNPKQTTLVWQGIVGRLEEQGSFAEIEDFLQHLSEELGKSPAYWMKRAEACRSLDRRDDAISFLEVASGMLTEKRNLADLIRIHRLIYDMDPKRADTRKRLQRLLALEERKEALKSRKFSWVGGISIGLMALSILPIRYELNARELFQRADLMERASAQGRQFDEARNLYAQVVENFRYSSRVDDAQDRIAQLRRIEDAHRRAEQERLEAEQERARLERQQRVEFAQGLAARAAIAEKNGQLQEARRLLEELLRDFGPLIDTQRVLFPLLIESEPSGATVYADGVEAGTTPLLHRLKPRGRSTLRLQLLGCVDKELSHEDTGVVRMKIQLERAPIGKSGMPLGVDGSPTVAAGYMLVPCRDGWLYCFSRASLDVQEAVWRRKAGIEGHPSARVQTFGNLVLLSSVSGVVDLAALADGKTVWSFQADTPITAHALLAPTREAIAIGCEDGAVHLIDAATGKASATASGQYPVVDLQFADRRLLVVDRGRRLRTYSLPNLGLLQESELVSSPTAFLPGGRILLADGQVVGGGDALPAPSAVSVSGDSVAVGGHDGRWFHSVGDDQAGGSVPGGVVHPPVRIEEQVFVGCTDQRLYCCGLDGEVRWSIAVGGFVSGVVATPAETLIVFVRDGTMVEIRRSHP
ncbi:MAG: DUF4388 domain-containing protein [Planctomycetota bacterium]